jgi:hypothetical protein
MYPSLQGRQAPAQPSLGELQALADAMTGGSVRLQDPVWRTYFGSSTATPAATRPAGSSWPATPPTSTARPAPRA